MPRSKPHLGKREPLPENFESIDDFQEFWDTHSSADYEELMEDVKMDVDVRSSRVYCAVAKDILTQLRVQARRQGVSTETLINLWLREKAAEAA
jgi:CopG antitoxin of type II toxin-antitoxin system